MATEMDTQGPSQQPDQPALPLALHIADLPVDVMLEVFSRVPATDLTLGASAVCRTWRELAVEPAAWAGRRLQVAPRKHRPLSAAERVVLRRAPALRALAVSLRRAQDLPAPLSDLLPSCGQLRELHLSLPSLGPDMAADVRRHWPRLSELRVEACRIQGDSLEQVSQLQQVRVVQLATLEPDVWPRLRRVARTGWPSLKCLLLDARVPVPDGDGDDGPAGVILELSDRLQTLRIGALIPASSALFAAVGQCTKLASLHVEDCSALDDDGLLRLAGLRLQSLSLCNAKQVSMPAVLRLLRLADLSLLRRLDLSACPALSDAGLCAVLRLLDRRCPQPFQLVAERCPQLSNRVLQNLHQPAPNMILSLCNSSVESVVHSAPNVQLGVA